MLYYNHYSSNFQVIFYRIFDPVVPCEPLSRPHDQSTLKQQHLQNSMGKRYLHQQYFKYIFGKLSNDTQVVRLYTFCSPVIDV